MHFISAGFYHNIFSRCKELSDWRKPHTKRNFRRQTAQLEIYSRGLLVYLRVPTDLIKLHGDWKSDCYQKYLSFSLEDKLLVFAKMKENLIQFSS